MKNRTQGYIFVIVGFVLIVTNALKYILDWDNKFTPVGIIGIVLVAIGMKMFKRM